MPPTLPQRAARPSAFVLAALVAGLTLGSMSRAYALVATPNEALFRYNFPANGELLITVPVINQAVHVMAVCESHAVRGIAFAEILRTNPERFLMWIGQNSDGVSAGQNTSGFSNLDETQIADVSFQGDVELEVQNATTLALSNESGGARAGYVTLIW